MQGSSDIVPQFRYLGAAILQLFNSILDPLSPGPPCPDGAISVNWKFAIGMRRLVYGHAEVVTAFGAFASNILSHDGRDKARRALARQCVRFEFVVAFECFSES